MTQAEIEGLYKRFRTLDRGHKVCWWALENWLLQHLFFQHAEALLVAAGVPLDRGWHKAVHAHHAQFSHVSPLNSKSM